MQQTFHDKFRRLKKRLLWKSLRTFSLGITTTEDYSVRNNIRLTSLIQMITIFGTAGMGIFFIINSYYYQGGACFLTASILFYPLSLNRRGKNLQSKLFTTCTMNIALIFWCCIFTHKSILNTYFLFIGTVCIYMYTRKERKWVVFTVTLSLLCFLVESSRLRDYLPQVNLVLSPVELQQNNNILLGGLIVMFVGEVSVFVYLSEIKEKKLSNTRTMLIASRKKLRRQNDDLKIFGAAASHSLQTPICISQFFVDKIRKEIDDNKVKETTLNYFDIINSSLSQMEGFITGLFSYYNVVDIESKTENVDIGSELTTLKNMMLQKYFDADISIPEKSLIINTNRLLLVVILQNLIENALKYNRSPFPMIKIEFVKDKNTFSILVEDNGIGIDQAFWERIFVPFVRINNDQTVRGAGLGLAGSKRAAEVIGAKLYCANSDSSGSIFRIDFLFSENNGHDKNFFS